MGVAAALGRSVRRFTAKIGCERGKRVLRKKKSQAKGLAI